MNDNDYGFSPPAVPPVQPPQGSPPPQGYAPPPQGYAPPPQGYAPPPGYPPQPPMGPGYPQPYQQGYPQPGKGLAVWGFILALISFLCCGLPGLFLAPVGLGLSLGARSKGFKGGLATAGLILAGIALAVSIFYCIWLYGFGGQEMVNEMMQDIFS